MLAEWHQARRAEFEAVERHQELEANPEGEGRGNPDFYADFVMKPAMDRCNAAFRVLARVVPSTPADPRLMRVFVCCIAADIESGHGRSVCLQSAGFCRKSQSGA